MPSSKFGKAADSLSTLIIKIASRCNIDCTYCYEYNRGDESWKSQPKHLSLKTAEMIGHRIKEFSDTIGRKEFTIVFHGGEPLLVGVTYLQQLIDTLLNSARDVNLKFGMQTNGILIDQEYIKLFQKNKISVGVSLDGDKFANRNRIYKKGYETFDRVVEAIRLLNDAKCLSGIQAVIDLCSEPADVLKFLSDFHPPLIELAQPLGSYDNPPHENTPSYTLGDWLVKAYQFWEQEDCMRGINIAVFAEAFRSMVHGKGGSDWFPGLPPNYMIIATDGFYEGLDALKINGEYGRKLNLQVNSHTIINALDHEYISSRVGPASLPSLCSACSISDWCCGGAYASRYGNNNGFNNKSIYCSDMKKLFGHLGRAALSAELAVDVRQKINAKLQQLQKD